MAKRYFKDFYGCAASISETRDGCFVLRVSAGTKRTNKTYDTYRGARSAMSRMSDGWREIAQ